MTFPREGDGARAGGAARRAGVIGTGLIGGSVGLALRARGWHVTGRDRDPARAERALELGALDQIGDDPSAEVVFLATPAGAVAETAATLRARMDGGAVVTDVAGVKSPIVGAIDHPRFVGGHPMAGSEQEGVDGADATLFEGATWVLTPTDTTEPEAYARVLAVVSSLGADAVAMPAARHDEMVAMVSHVPHLTAGALMNLAADAAAEQASILRLAAGGFRDMTRIAAGHPGIWPDVCVDNRVAITATLDSLLDALGGLRAMVSTGDREAILAVLGRARDARMNLPARSLHPEELAEIRIPVPDRPGVLADVTTGLGERSVNIYDLEIVHSAAGPRGVLVLKVDRAHAQQAIDALAGLGYHPALRPLAP
ncbi:MAG TPA: prephenate dehydrogenase/arogenate dehydrogenase family protein [Acidimicrobiales bacterium]|nr:prephenate dehydrogenase/arogenate dehydrogenase family protein [Acidimicrobiales bacterium]